MMCFIIINSETVILYYYLFNGTFEIFIYKKNEFELLFLLFNNLMAIKTK